MTPLLHLENVTWEADGRRILGPLSLDIAAGECLVIVGPNGAGKTTLLRVLAGLLTPTTGRLTLGGDAVQEVPRKALARQIAYVPQLRPMHLPLTVEEVVLLGRYPYLSRWQLSHGSEDRAAVTAALAEVGLEALRQRPMENLSGGERQGVFIAAALAQEAAILILDEPTTHLDPKHQRDVARLLLRLGRDRRRTVITATHDLAFAALLADRVCALRGGESLALGAPHGVLEPATLHRLFGADFRMVAPGVGPAIPMLQLAAEGEG
jgi:iron complex transport system ATP-binding protein